MAIDIICAIGGATVTALVALLINRLNRKDTLADKETATIADLNEKMDKFIDNFNTQIEGITDLLVSEVRDKLRHTGTTYLGNPDKVTVAALRDWLMLYAKYKALGGNSHVEKLAEEIDTLLLEKEKEEAENRKKR